jgi:hypothetical protein
VRSVEWVRDMGGSHSHGPLHCSEYHSRKQAKWHTSAIDSHRSVWAVQVRHAETGKTRVRVLGDCGPNVGPSVISVSEVHQHPSFVFIILLFLL